MEKDLHAFYIRIMNKKKEGYDISEDIYSIISTICADLNVKIRDGGDIQEIDLITDQVKNAIKKADLVFADASSNNENIWYEIGYADSVDYKKVILISCERDEFPFDRSAVRAFSYRRGSHKDYQDIEKKIRSAVEQIVGVASCAAARQARSDTGAVRTQTDPIALNPDATSALVAAALDAQNASTYRRKHLDGLFALGHIPDELFIKLTNTDEDDDVRTSIFLGLAEYGSAPPLQAWKNGLSERESVKVMRALAKAATRHFLLGHMDEQFFTEYFVKHPRWEIRKHVTVTLAESLADWNNNGAVEALLQLAQDSREEVFNRVMEAFGDVCKNGTRSRKKLAFLEKLYAIWKNRKERNIKEFMKNLQSGIDKSKSIQGEHTETARAVKIIKKKPTSSSTAKR